MLKVIACNIFNIIVAIHMAKQVSLCLVANHEDKFTRIKVP